MCGSKAKKVDLSPLLNLESIGSGFFESSDIEELDLRELKKVETVEFNLFRYCKKLKKILVTENSKLAEILIRRGFKVTYDQTSTAQT